MDKPEDAAGQASQISALRESTAEVAHEFANLWTAASGILALMRARPDLEPELRQDLAALNQLMQAGQRLTRHLGRLSRQGTTRRRTFALDRLLTREVGRIRQVLPPTIEVSCQVEPGNYRIHGVRDQLRLTLWTLAFNARDAMVGGGHLRFALRETRERVPWEDVPFGLGCELSVSDDGCGMESEVAARAFDARFSTKPAGAVHGLGLHHLKRIVERHRGHVVLESRAGQGTSVLIRLPRWEQPSPESRRVSASVPASDATSRRMVLVVDDDPDSREVICELIQAVGYEVIAAAGGHQALERHGDRGGEMALVLTDLNMPDLGGADLIQALAKRDPQLRFVVISGDSSRAGLDGRSRKRVSAWLTKPVDLARLRRVLRRVLSAT